jgi:Fe2+ or Zn2+ uptake regulation protein
VRPLVEEVAVVLARAEGDLTAVQVRGRLAERFVKAEPAEVEAALLALQEAGRVERRAKRWRGEERRPGQPWPD